MGKSRIILVDDHELFLQGLISLLDQQKEFEIVGHVHSGKELFKLLKRQTCDLVVTDLFMPDLDGMETIKRIKEMDVDIKILV
ncbi:MAG: response regulator transcription factor, partial [Candidatus Omnitrophica bacterium]|nr:response regulator transcription factor [Candidatus Omnitrophota bacterium]